MHHFVLCSLTASATEPDFKSKDWVFLNYTYKRFEGLTQRGTIPTYMKAGKAWYAALGETDVYGHRVRLLSPTAGEGCANSLSINLTLIPGYLGLLSRCKSCQELRKLSSITALPRLFISYTRAVFYHSSQAISLTRTLKHHICMFSSLLLLGSICFLTAWR